MIQTEPVFFTFIQLTLIQVYFRDWNFRFLLILVICGVIITYRRETWPN